ncbi:MAG: aldehyde dehydrogenase family protein [Mailhella sp.]|nr:aldehyde dehydrogenase family protein [Mailhella sp.]
MDLKSALASQRLFFASGTTLDVSYRIAALKRLHDAVLKREADIAEVLREDLGKSSEEAYLTETGIVLHELSHAIRRLRFWAMPRFGLPSPAAFPGLALAVSEPLGSVLIFSPWNYPVHLAFMPLIAAVAAGNCAVVKPSSSAPCSGRLILDILRSVFPPEHVFGVSGGHDNADRLLSERFDFIFYTGSGAVAGKISRAAAVHLTPVCLELGGKSPVICAEDADLEKAAARIARGKSFNAGQTCVAPDHVYAHETVIDALCAELRVKFSEYCGAAPLGNPSYPRIVSEKHFDRLLSYGFEGLRADRASLRIAPLVIRVNGFTPDPFPDDEIFGPVLPVIPYSDRSELLAAIRSKPKPLALYLFTRDRQFARTVIKTVPFGGGCVNDTVMHLASGLPFGGVGASGTGRYHGKSGFDLLSNKKSILVKAPGFDLPLAYPPFTRSAMRIIRKMLR